MSNSYQMVPLRDVLQQRSEFIEIDDFKAYKRCRVQLHAQGIIERDIVQGIDIKTKKQQVCHTGEFLVAEIDAKVGGFGIVPDNLDGAIVSNHYFLFSVDETVLSRRFLEFFVRTPAFMEQVRAQGTTNYAAIRPGDVLGYKVPLPSPEEQLHIVARIEELAARIEEARGLRWEGVEETKTLINSVMRRTFSSNNEYQLVPLESVCGSIIDNLHSNPVYADQGIPCVRSPDVGWGKLYLDTALKTSEEEYIRRTARGEPRPNDIVLVREGGGTGKAAIIEEGQRFSLGQRVMMLRPDKQVVMPKFLLYQLLSPVIYEDQILPLSKGSASPHLNIGALRNFSFVLPSLPEQYNIVAYLDNLQSKVDSLKQLRSETGAELDALLPSILDKAFKGKL